MKNLLITGATGRLGANLIKELDGQYQIRSFVMKGDPLVKKLEKFNTEIFYGDLRDAKGIVEACRGMNMIIHAGAIMEDKPAGMDNVTYFDVNTRGTFCFLEAARSINIERFVYLSTTATFDVFNTPENAMPITEKTVQRPGTLYGLTKVANERFIFGFHFQHELPVTILRPNYIMAGTQVLEPWTSGTLKDILKTFGKDPHMSFYAPGVAEPWKPVEKLEVPDDTLCIPRGPDGRSWTWHMVDVRDMVQAVKLCLEKSACVGEDFNIAGPYPTTWEEAAQYLSVKTGKKVVEVTIPNFWMLKFDITKAKKLLGYNPQYDICRMIDDALDYQNGKYIDVIPA